MSEEPMKTSKYFNDTELSEMVCPKTPDETKREFVQTVVSMWLSDCKKHYSALESNTIIDNERELSKHEYNDFPWYKKLVVGSKKRWERYVDKKYNTMYERIHNPHPINLSTLEQGIDYGFIKAEEARLYLKFIKKDWFSLNNML